VTIGSNRRDQECEKAKKKHKKTQLRSFRFSSAGADSDQRQRLISQSTIWTQGKQEKSNKICRQRKGNKAAVISSWAAMVSLTTTTQ
jgi:hypothetical protein